MRFIVFVLCDSHHHRAKQVFQRYSFSFVKQSVRKKGYSSKRPPAETHTLFTHFQQCPALVVNAAVLSVVDVADLANRRYIYVRLYNACLHKQSRLFLVLNRLIF